MRGIFITATDTGAGKTFVTAMIARALRANDVVVRACKPVATGAEWIDGRWLSEDTRVLGRCGRGRGLPQDNTLDVSHAGRAACGGQGGRR